MARAVIVATFLLSCTLVSSQEVTEAVFNVPLSYRPISGPTDPCVFAPTPDNVNNNNSMATMDALVACFTSFPYSSASAAQIVNNAHSLLNRFAFSDMVTYTGPPWNKELDVHAALEATLAAAGNFTSDFAFHEVLTRFFVGFNDAHVNYVKPPCYTATLIQVITPRPVYSEGAMTLVASPLNWNGTNMATLLLSNATLTDLLGQTITAINGMDAVPYITRFAQTAMNRATDISGLFNAALSLSPPLFPVRGIGRYPMPDSTTVNYTLLRQNGTSHTVSIPWLAFLPPVNGTEELLPMCTYYGPRASLNCSIAWSNPAQFPNCKNNYESGDIDGNNDLIGKLSSAHVTHMALPEDESAHPHVSAAVDSLKKWLLPHEEEVKAASESSPAYLRLGKAEPQPFTAMPADMVSIYTSPGFQMGLQFDPATSLLHMRLKSFQPPNMTACWTAMANATWCCDTWDVANSTFQCITEVMEAWMAVTVDGMWQAWSDYNAVGLVVDLTTNGGGTNIYGYAVMAGWVQSLYDDPLRCISRYELRKDGLWADMLDFFAAAEWVPLPILISYSAYFFADVGGGVLAPLNRHNASAWYTDWQQQYRGNSSYPFSRAIRVTQPDWIRSFIKQRPPVELNPSNLLLVTDGTCGSLCSHFTKALVENGAARTLYLGGLPAVDGDCSAFAGGYTMYVGEFGDADTVTVLNQLGFIPSSTTTYVPIPTDQSIAMRYPWPGGLDWLYPEHYLQYTLNKPDAQLYVWGPTMNLPIFSAMAAAAPIVLALPTRASGGASFVVAPENTPDTTSFEIYRLATFILSGVCGLLLFIGGYLCHHAAVVRRALAKERSGFDPALRQRMNSLNGDVNASGVDAASDRSESEDQIAAALHTRYEQFDPANTARRSLKF